ncbi:class I SAM-dependent methyltransferase [Pelagibacteraceae bacterium]|nr:class I SAM-dependent methyltransferase [Pelagibacteraceae bacterium]
MNFYSKIYKSLIFKLKKKINLDNSKIKKKELNRLFNYFGTDKGTNVLNPYTKLKKKIFFKGHGFGKFYEKHFSRLKNNNLNILEIGVWEGASTASFFHYFKRANFFAVDRNFKFQYTSKRINFIFCDTTSVKELKKFNNILKLKNISSFDIIIDDGSHILSNMFKNFSFFFKRLKSGGIYVIEDYKHPNYFSYLKDLKNHIFIDKALNFFKNKKVFKSSILSKNEISYLNSKIKKIFTYKGECIEKNKNISDIAFIYKKMIKKN